MSKMKTSIDKKDNKPIAISVKKNDKLEKFWQDEQWKR